jgi:hypothetical protein
MNPHDAERTTSHEGLPGRSLSLANKSAAVCAVPRAVHGSDAGFQTLSATTASLHQSYVVRDECLWVYIHVLLLLVRTVLS